MHRLASDYKRENRIVRRGLFAATMFRFFELSDAKLEIEKEKNEAPIPAYRHAVKRVVKALLNQAGVIELERLLREV